MEELLDEFERREAEGREQPHRFMDVPWDLRERPQWVCWRLEPRSEQPAGKATKVPYRADGLGKASSTDSATWCSFDDAAVAVEEGGFDGIGFVLTDDDPFVGVDLDNCRNAETGEIELWAWEVVTALDSYTEVSPSDAGLHVFVRAALPSSGRRRGSIELYQSRRYLTITGARLGYFSTAVEGRQEEIDALYDQTFGSADGEQPHEDTSAADDGRAPDRSNAEVLALAFRAPDGDVFARLHAGNQLDYPSTSEADAAYLQRLSIHQYCDYPAIQLDELFRSSGRMRPKWDERRGDRTYGEMTIEAVLGWERERRDTKSDSRQERSAPQEERVDDLPRPIDWPLFWATDRNAESWLAYPFCPYGRGVSIYSPAKVGKSLIALNVAAALATGRPIFGGDASAPISVIYLDLEMTEDDLEERLIDMGYGPTVDLSNLHYFLLPSLPPLDTAEGGLALVALTQKYDAKMVVIDTTGRVLSGKENESDTLRAYYRHTGQLLKAAGLTTLRLDHAGKDVRRGQRGTSAKNDDVDLVWELTGSTEEGYRLKATHRRQGWIPERFGLVTAHEPLRFEVVDNIDPPRTAEVAAELDALDIPITCSAREAIAALRAVGKSARREVVLAAIRYRKRTGTASGTDSDSATEPEDGTATN